MEGPLALLGHSSLRCFGAGASAALGKPGPLPLWRHRGLGDTGVCATLETPRPPPFWDKGLRRFGETRASASLGQGHLSLWGMCVHPFGDTGASAALKPLGPPLPWEHQGFCALGKPWLPALSSVGLRRFGQIGASDGLWQGPVPLWGELGLRNFGDSTRASPLCAPWCLCCFRNSVASAAFGVGASAALGERGRVPLWGTPKAVKPRYPQSGGALGVPKAVEGPVSSKRGTPLPLFGGLGVYKAPSVAKRGGGMRSNAAEDPAPKRRSRHFAKAGEAPAPMPRRPRVYTAAQARVCPKWRRPQCRKSGRSPFPKAVEARVFRKPAEARAPKSKAPVFPKRQRPLPQSGGSPSVPGAAEALAPKRRRPQCRESLGGPCPKSAYMRAPKQRRRRTAKATEAPSPKRQRPRRPLFQSCGGPAVAKA